MLSRADCHFFFFNDTATTEIYTLSLHDALPIFEIELDSGRAAQAMHQDQRRTASSADVVDVDPVDRHRAAIERRKRLHHDLSLSASGSAADRDGRGKPEVGEHGTADQVQRDVEAGQGKSAEQVADKDSQEPKDEQDHTDH